MIAVKGLSVRLGEREVLTDVDLQVRRGAWLAVIGPNGAGKSTLLKAVMGLLAHRGEVTLDGRPAGALSPRDRARLVAYAPQTPALPPDMTVFDYALLGRTPYIPYLGRESRTDRRRHRVRAGPARPDPVRRPQASASCPAASGSASCSPGRSPSRPPVLLLDEPTTALDLGHQQQVLELVDRLRLADELTVVTTLHDLTVAGQYADHLLLLAGGRAVACGEPAEVLTVPLVSGHFDARVMIEQGPGGRPVVHLLRGEP